MNRTPLNRAAHSRAALHRAPWMVVALLTASQPCFGGSPKAPSVISVCMARTSQPRLAAEARSLTSIMFQSVGVKLAWRDGLAGCDPQGIRIDVGEATSPSLFPGVLAWAMPYAGLHAPDDRKPAPPFHIRVFFDRVQLMGDRLAPHLLAHVLTHELTHVLQGVNRHTSEGVMKARWTQNDYTTMLHYRLTLTADDIDLLRRGIALRAERQNEEALARNSEKARVSAGS